MNPSPESVCPTCKGSGHDPRFIPGADVLLTCPTCNGTGKAPNSPEPEQGILTAKEWLEKHSALYKGIAQEKPLTELLPTVPSGSLSIQSSELYTQTPDVNTSDIQTPELSEGEREGQIRAILKRFEYPAGQDDIPTLDARLATEALLTLVARERRQSYQDGFADGIKQGEEVHNEMVDELIATTRREAVEHARKAIPHAKMPECDVFEGKDCNCYNSEAWQAIKRLEE